MHRFWVIQFFLGGCFFYAAPCTLGFSEAVHYIYICSAWPHLLYQCWLALEVRAPLNPVLVACHRFKRAQASPLCLFSLLFHAGQAAIKPPSAEASKRAQCTSPGHCIPYIKGIMKTPYSWIPIKEINVKNFHGSLTTVVRAQNDTSKTANITDTMFDRTYWYSPYKRRRFENRWDQTFCILLITDVLSECKPPPTPKLETKVIRDSYSD